MPLRSSPQQLPVLKTLAAGAAVISMLGGVAVLSGWTLDPELLRRLTPGQETTKPIGALGLLCAGAALFLLRPAERGAGAWRHGLGVACAGVALAIGVLTLLEQGLDVDLGIDRLLFAEALVVEGPHPGRAVFPIPLCLMLLGLALIALPTKRARVADPLAGLALFVGLLVMIGYLYEAVPLYRVEPQRPVPVVSTVLVIVLALGCLAARPGSALVEITASRGAGGVAARRLLPAAVLVPLLLGLLRLVGQRFGLYGTEFGLALFATLNIAVFVALVAAIARRLDEAEASREAAHAALLESEERAADEIRSLNSTLERRVEERTRQLSRAQEMAHVGSWELDLVNDALRWSDEVYRIFGLAPQEFEANYAAFLESVHPDDRAMVDAAYAGSIREGRDSYEIEHRIVRSPGGEVRFVHEKCEHFRDQAGRVVRSMGMVHDITERKRAEESLRGTAEKLDERTRELNAVLSSVQDPVYIFDPAGRFVFANKRLLDLWGLTAEQAIGRTMRDLAYPEEAEAVLLEGARQVRETGRVVTNVTHYTSPPGPAGSYENILAPMLGPDGEVAFVAGSSRDITERRHAQAQLSAALQHKEALLKEIHHRVKNNMQVVCSLLRLQSDAVRDPRVREVLAESQRRVRAMALLHEQLYRSSDLARIDFGCYVRSLVSYLRRSLAAVRPEVEIRVDVDGVLLDMDQAMPLGLLVSELVTNSLKHAFPADEDARGRLVWVAARREPSAGLTLSVGDNGVGLPPHVDLQGSPSMGLKLVKSFVDQLHGSLAFERRSGTVVTVTLPRQEA